MKPKFLPLLAASLLAPAFSHAGEGKLSGDTKLACEAILCLSSGTRPQECAPSLARYFGISHKKIHKTISARKNFLHLCPTGGEEGMPQLIDAIAEGAGRCDAAELNRVMRRTITVRQCEPEKVPKRANNAQSSMIFSPTHKSRQKCQDVKKTVVLNIKPAYCNAYHNHGWTRTGVEYIGDPKNGGRWADKAGE